MDEALGLPTVDAARIALRTQQVIGYESGVADTADALAGSYAIEHLTNEIERLACEYIQKIDDLGGMLRAIEAGFVQREIDRASYEYQLGVEANEQIVVGVNRFTMEEGTAMPLLRLDEKSERQQIERVQAIRTRRDAKATEGALTRIEQAARTGENLMPPIIAAVEAYATLGEISDRLRNVFGEYTGANYD
jgi:methylmalonyl-CoA mutase, N-terminal domain